MAEYYFGRFSIAKELTLGDPFKVFC